MISAALFLEVLALTGGTVHTLVPGEVPGPATLLVRDGHIEAVGADLEVPADARVIDVSGKHLVPGLIDAMVNFDPDHDGLYLAAGVTFLRDRGGELSSVMYDADPARRDALIGPAVATAGVELDGVPPSAPNAIPLRTSDDVHHAVPTLARAGVNYITTGASLTPELWRKVIEVAHANDLDVWSQFPQGLSFEEALEEDLDGVLFIEQLKPAGVSWDRVFPGALKKRAEAMAAAEMPLVPFLMGTAYRLRSPEIGSEVLPLLAPHYEAWWAQERQTRGLLVKQDPEAYLKRGKEVLERQLQLAGYLHDAGAQILPGSGSPWPWLVPGQALHDELALLWRDAGIPADEVLALATREAAELIGEGERRGTLEAGKVADVLVVGEDPRDDLGTLRRPELVVLRGRALERKELLERLVFLERRMDAQRAEIARPIVVPDLVLPEGDVLVSGEVETRHQTLRSCVEKYAAVQTGGETRSFLGHMVFPGVGGDPDRHLKLRQDFRKGKLEGFEAVLELGEDTLVARGLWAANTLRIERRLNGAFISTDTLPKRPQAIAVGSATGVLALDERRDPGEVLLLELLGADLGPEYLQAVRRDPQDGVEYLGTDLGFWAWQRSKTTAIARWERGIAGQIFVTMPTEVFKRFDAAIKADAEASAQAAADAAAGSGTGTVPASGTEPAPANGGEPAPEPGGGAQTGSTPDDSIPVGSQPGGGA